MLAKPLIQDSAQTRMLQPGDVLAGGEIATSITTVGAGTLTGASLVTNTLHRTGPTAAFTDTTDTAANIIAAINSQYAQGCQPGTTWRIKYSNQVSFTGTLAAGTGVTLAGTTVAPGQSQLDLRVRVDNGTPTSVTTGTLDGTTAVITGMSQAATAAISPGMGVSGTGVPASTTVLSVQQGVGVTISNATTIAGSLVSLTFVPQVTITGLGCTPYAGIPDLQDVTATTTNATLAAGAMEGSKINVLRLSANNANAITTRTADQIIAGIPNARIGQSWLVRVHAAGDNTVTLTGGTGVTISGTATIATGVKRDYVLTYTAASTMTLTNTGALAA